MTTNPVTGVRLDPDLHARLMMLADDNGHTLSGYMRHVLKQHVKENIANGWTYKQWTDHKDTPEELREAGNDAIT